MKVYITSLALTNGIIEAEGKMEKLESYEFFASKTGNQTFHSIYLLANTV